MGVSELALEVLNPFNVVSNLGNSITGIWNWLLYNLITPFILIVFIILFFWGQYKLFRAYFFVIGTVVSKLSAIIPKVAQTKQVKSIVENLTSAFK